MVVIAAALVGYLLGSIPFALLVGRLAGVADIRKEGSSNMGTLNVLRVVGLLPAALTLTLDLGKGLLAAYFGGILAGQPEGALAGSLGVVLGHILPVFAGFRGGKSIAVYVGATSLFNFHYLLALGLLWVVTYILLRRVAVTSALTFLMGPVLMYLYGYSSPFIIYTALAGVAIALRHLPDIKRGR